MGEKSFWRHQVWRISSFWQWRRKAQRWWQWHPPFLFSLLKAAFEARHGRPEIEAHRAALLQDSSVLSSQDAGAGSSRMALSHVPPVSTTAQIAKNSLKRKRHASALAAWCETSGAREILELGTSLGITTAYLAQAKESQITTIECNGDRLDKARLIWSHLGCQDQIQAIQGTFDDVLETLLGPNRQWDFIFIDGHHEGAALRRYVDNLLPHLSHDGLLVCDDIHWSPDMEEAWADIRRMPHWTLTLDVFEMGLVTRRRGLTRMDADVILRGNPRPVL